MFAFKALLGDESPLPEIAFTSKTRPGDFTAFVERWRAGTMLLVPVWGRLDLTRN
jgi:hypothetical protein